MDEAYRAEVQRQLREETNEKFAKRRSDDRARALRYRADTKFRQQNNLAPRLPQLDFLAIGDSWFDYPLNDHGGLWPNQDIVAQLKLLGNPPPVIKSRAVHGQTMTEVMSLGDQNQYMADIHDPDIWTSGKPDAILVSGGGNDVAGDQFVIYLDYAGRGLDVARFGGLLDSIEQMYMALFKFRDKYISGVPIIGHCYDYAIPNGDKAFIFGPWLKPSLDFEFYHYDPQGLKIVKDAIDLFHGKLHSLANDASNNFKLVDTRGTLTRDRSHPLGWANEIHPYTAGFVALAQKFVTTIRHVFPRRI